MIISHSRKFVFIHVPKAAGTTVTKLLSRLTLYNDLELGGTPFGEALQPIYRARFGLSKHSNAAQVRQAMGEDVWQAYYSFAFVRNPFSRCLSTFEFLRGHLAHDTPFGKKCRTSDPVWAEKLVEAGGIDACVSSGILDAEQCFDGIFRPQIHWLCGAVQRDTVIVSFVGKMETFASDIATLLQKIGADEVMGELQNLPKRNKSKPTLAEETLSPEAEAMILAKYSRDFAAFGYKTANPLKKKEASAA